MMRMRFRRLLFLTRKKASGVFDIGKETRGRSRRRRRVAAGTRDARGRARESRLGDARGDPNPRELSARAHRRARIHEDAERRRASARRVRFEKRPACARRRAAAAAAAAGAARDAFARETRGGSGSAPAEGNADALTERVLAAETRRRARGRVHGDGAGCGRARRDAATSSRRRRESSPPKSKRRSPCAAAIARCDDSSAPPPRLGRARGDARRAVRAVPRASARARGAQQDAEPPRTRWRRRRARARAKRARGQGERRRERRETRYPYGRRRRRFAPETTPLGDARDGLGLDEFSAAGDGGARRREETRARAARRSVQLGLDADVGPAAAAAKASRADDIERVAKETEGKQRAASLRWRSPGVPTRPTSTFVGRWRRRRARRASSASASRDDVERLDWLEARARETSSTRAARHARDRATAAGAKAERCARHLSARVEQMRRRRRGGEGGETRPAALAAAEARASDAEEKLRRAKADGARPRRSPETSSPLWTESRREGVAALRSARGGARKSLRKTRGARPARRRARRRHRQTRRGA